MTNIEKLDAFEVELTRLINKWSVDNMYDTPDFIISSYMRATLNNFRIATLNREHWFGYKLQIGGPVKIND